MSATLVTIYSIYQTRLTQP